MFAVTPLARAEIDICNATMRLLEVTYQAPASNCATGSRQDRIWLNPSSCWTVGYGSAAYKSFFYHAVDLLDPDAFWAGDAGIWVPDSPNANCTRSVSCHPSGGDRCGGGRVYGMRENIDDRARYSLTLTE